MKQQKNFIRCHCGFGEIHSIYYIVKGVAISRLSSPLYAQYQSGHKSGLFKLSKDLRSEEAVAEQGKRLKQQ